MNKRFTTKLVAAMMAVCLIAMSVPFAATAETVLSNIKNFRATTATTGGKLVLQWNKVKNADGYEIYRCEPEETEFTLLETTTKRKYTRRDHALYGVAYKYQICPIAYEEDGTITRGEMSKVLSAKFVTHPTGLKLSGGAQKITVRYTAPLGAKGIQIYMKAPDETKYTKKATITSGKEKYVVTGLLAETTYSVKVRAYWKIGKKTFYTAYTNAKNVTTD